MTLSDVEEQAFEVAAFGMEEGDRVVAGLDVARDDGHFAASFEGCLEDDLLEEGFIDEVGTGASEQVGVGWHDLHGSAVDPFIATASFIYVLSLLSKGGRIEDDDVEGSLSFFEVIEDIGSDDLVFG